MHRHDRSRPLGSRARIPTTGQGNYTQPNPRGCPGSYARVKSVGGIGVCPFCNTDRKMRADGTLKAHARPN